MKKKTLYDLALPDPSKWPTIMEPCIGTPPKPKPEDTTDSIMAHYIEPNILPVYNTKKLEIEWITKAEYEEMLKYLYRIIIPRRKDNRENEI